MKFHKNYESPRFLIVLTLVIQHYRTNSRMRWNCVNVITYEICKHTDKYVGHSCTSAYVVYIFSCLRSCHRIFMVWLG